MNLFLKLYPIFSALHWYTNFAVNLSLIQFLILTGFSFLLGYLYSYLELSEKFPSFKYGPRVSQAVSLYPSLMKYLEKNSINNCGNYLECSGKYYGEEIVIRIPYSNQMRRKMQGLRVILYKGIEKLDITHQPGIPYFLTANQMEGSKIQIVRGDKIIKTFGSEVIPKL